MRIAICMAGTLCCLMLLGCAHERGPEDRPPGGSRDGESLGMRGPVMASGNHLIDDKAQQLDRLHEQLRLRSDQEAYWLDYLDKADALWADQLRAPIAPRSPSVCNAPCQVDRKTDVVRDRLAAMEDIADATRRLYGQLDNEQRSVADQFLANTVPVLYSGIGTDSQASPGRRERGGRPDRGPPPH